MGKTSSSSIRIKWTYWDNRNSKNWLKRFSCSNLRKTKKFNKLERRISSDSVCSNSKNKNKNLKENNSNIWWSLSFNNKSKTFKDKLSAKESNSNKKSRTTPNKNFYKNTKLNVKPFCKTTDSKGKDNSKKRFIAKRSRKKYKKSSEFRPFKGPKDKWTNAKLENMKLIWNSKPQRPSSMMLLCTNSANKRFKKKWKNNLLKRLYLTSKPKDNLPKTTSEPSLKKNFSPQPCPVFTRPMKLTQSSRKISKPSKTILTWETRWPN